MNRCILSLQIKTDFLSRLFGKFTRVEFFDDSLILKSKSGKERCISYSDLEGFLVFKKKLWGGKISINAGEVFYLNFLQSTPDKSQVIALNKLIAQHIENKVEHSFREYKTKAVDEFLRDSNIADIDDALQSVLNPYKKSKRNWAQYISLKTLEQLDVIEDAYPVKKNVVAIRKEFEKRSLSNRQSFYDNIESNPLTDEQRLAVIRDNDRNLVLAAAGTGKTSVMVAKALDLVDRNIAKPEEILVLAYNNAAAAELRERMLLRGKAVGIAENNMPQIQTFHALGRGIMQTCNKSVRISHFMEDPIKFEMWLSEWFIKKMKTDRKFLSEFIDLQYQPVNPFDFKTKKEYDDYVRDNEYRTLQGERVKGYQELLIANWLFMNGIAYQYEAPYVTKRRIEIGFDYKPDFHFTGTDIYLEHFGIDREGNTRPDIDSEKYNQEIESKRALHKEQETTLLETFHYQFCENNLLESLEEAVVNAGFSISPKSENDIFETLKNSGVLIEGIKRYMKCLQAIRVEELNEKSIRVRLQQHGIEKSKQYSIVLAELLHAYKDELRKQGAIDFDDMIIKASACVQSGEFKPQWSHILVDEFQDISAARMNLLNQVIEKGNKPALTAVGDDWQSIYRFSGGKLELTTQFEKRVGSCSITKLQKTFRYNNSIADTAGRFVMKNPEQYVKNVVTHTQVSEQQVFIYDDRVGDSNNLELKTKQIVAQIRANDPTGSIAILARYRYLLNDAKQALSFSKQNENIKYWTFHGSKGLEADYCILIGFNQGKKGFPNQNEEEAVVEALLPSLDSFKHSEERRLMYVALTRAKNQSHLIADPMAPSEFITELLAPEFDLHIESDYFAEQHRKIYKCAHCSDGYYQLRKGKFGDFYSCTSGSVCRSKPRMCETCGAPSIDGKHSSKCNNPNCETEMKLCGKCARPMKLRSARYGQFWGCSGYAIKADQCTHTEKVDRPKAA
ncbi:UvrD-helicase domain-containing protein [Thalassomonas sp. M1454]|uniref:UvrD-helicase domain-containing protein n=1 Tax=Thalassomonas sp. M1454 TaxID=2594477 RepID=UPI00117F2CCE|nr:UvrD-helicase domain-containing protein [Thalassomonas sp. M1454]TRX57167.1 AAA family ATPase [Thalassomonas sp. M1454]